MPSADQVPTKLSHSTMLWHEWVVLIAGSTGSALRAVRPPNLHITPDVRRDLEPTLLDVDEEFTPALRALAHPGLETDKFLLAFGCRADQHQHAFGIVFHPGLQVDPVRPHVHVSSRREIALLPGVVIRLPRRRQPRDHGRRQIRRVLAQEASKRLLEIAG